LNFLQASFGATLCNDILVGGLEQEFFIFPYGNIPCQLAFILFRGVDRPPISISIYILLPIDLHMVRNTSKTNTKKGARSPTQSPSAMGAQEGITSGDLALGSRMKFKWEAPGAVGPAGTPHEIEIAKLGFT
jgi:hypothetical protein